MNDAANQKLVRSVDFLEGEFTTQVMVFSIPKKQKFTATSISFIPYYRRVSLSQSSYGPSDGVFSQAVWAFDPTQFSSTAFVRSAVDVYWRLSENSDGRPREYQNAPCSAAAAFSGTHPGWWQAETTAHPGGLVFDVPWELGGGSALSCQITPTYTATSPTTGMKNQFRIMAVLHGLRSAE